MHNKALHRTTIPVSLSLACLTKSNSTELPLPGLTSASLKTYIADGGGSDDFLFNGPKITEQIEVKTKFGLNGYRFKLAPTTDETFIINDEARYYEGGDIGWREMGSGHTTPELLRDKDKRGAAGGSNVASYIYDAIFLGKRVPIIHLNHTTYLTVRFDLSV